MIRLLTIGIGAFLGYQISKKLLNKSIFVSYRYKGDAKYKNLLKAWSANHKFDLSFDDFSNDVSVDSTEALVIKEAILNKMKKSDIFLCIVGSKTYKSKWVAWEIDKAVELDMPIVAVKINKAFPSPPSLKGNNVSWALSFKEKSITKALASV